MKLIDWCLESFDQYLKKYGQRGLLVSIILLSIPMALNASSVIIYLLHLMIPGMLIKTGFIGISILFLANYFLINSFLENEYLKRKRVLRQLHNYFLLIIPPAYFGGSVVLFIYSFRFL